LVSISGALGIDVVTSPLVTCGRLQILGGSTKAITLTNAANDVDTLKVLTKGDFTFSQTGGPLEINDPDTTLPGIEVESTGGNVTIACPGGLRVVDGIAWGASSKLSLSGGTGPGVEFVPTAVGDNAGLPFAGTLRDMLGYVNANTATNGASNTAMQVVFDEPGSPVATGGTIAIGTVSLPAISKVLTIDGTLPVAPGGIGGIAYVDGSAVVSGSANGFTLAAGSGGSVIENIGLHGFSNAAIDVVTGANTLRGLVLGAARSGDVSGNGYGIRIAGTGSSAAAAANVVGVKVAGDVGNVIVGSTFDGIAIGANAPYTQVFGNRIGELADGTSMGNGRHGISVQTSIGTVIGSTNPILANTISGSGMHGVLVVDVSGTSTVYGAQLFGNSIVGNAVAGVQIRGGARNLVGGIPLGAGNTITGGTYGIRLLPTAGTISTRDNTIIGNSVANATLDGIRIDRSNGNSITGNVVSGNGKTGIVIDSAPAVSGRSLANRVLGNTVSANGDSATNGGIVLRESSGQLIGQLGGANILANNSGSGIVVEGTTSTGNVIAANTVTASGFHGIVVSAATGNSVRRNAVSGNAQVGIAVIDAIARVATAENKVMANRVSANAVGIEVRGGKYQSVGGTLPTDGNAVFSNTSHGILVSPSVSSGPAQLVAVRNNQVGVDGSTVAGNGGYGIRIEESWATSVDYANLVSNNAGGGVAVQGGDGTVIGGQAVGRGNTVFRNGGNGISIVEPAKGNSPVNVKIAGNVIRDNAADGVGVSGSRTSGVVIGRNPSISMPNGAGNTVIGNGGAGVRVDQAQRVTMIGNSFGSNGVAPIVLANNGNSGVSQPNLTSVTQKVTNQARPQWDIRGTVSGTAGQRFYVDFYMDLASGGQGYMGRVLVTVASNGTGAFRTILNSPAGGLGGGTIRATATVATSGTLFGSTSAL
jgi:parallel beta-helix repeat protein